MAVGYFEPISFDRKDIYLHIQKRIAALEKGFRQNLGLIGVEGMGKSCMLQSLCRSLRNEPSVLPIYFNAEVLGYDHFIDRWIGSILKSIALKNRIQTSNDQQEMLERLTPFVPKTVDAIYNIRKLQKRAERNSTIIKEMFALTAVLSSEVKQKVLMMIDEFHFMDLLPTSDPFSILGKEIMVEKETLYLVASSKAELANQIFREKLSLLFSNFEVMKMHPLNEHEISDYLFEKQPGFIFTKAQERFLIGLTQGMPVYLDLILDQLGQCLPVNHASIETEDGERQGLSVPSERLLIACCKELYDRRGRLALVFEKKLEICKQFSKDHGPYLSALLAIAHGNRKAQSVASYINRKVRESKKILDRLVEAGLISKHGVFYVIEDGLFKYWIQNVYSTRIYGDIVNEANLQDEFYSALQNVFRENEKLTLRDVQNKVESLFKEFGNDLIAMGEKKVRFPQFSEVLKPARESGHEPIVAKCRNGRWVCYITMDPVDEEELSAYVKQFKRSRKRAQKRILIHLSDISQNAKLIAHEEKVQLWDSRCLNGLLDLYNFNRVILAHGKDVKQSPQASIERLEKV